MKKYKVWFFKKINEVAKLSVEMIGKTEEQ